MMDKIKHIVIHKNFLFYGALGVFILSLKYYFIPLNGDELKYFEIAENFKNHGQYYYKNQPSTFIPSIPLLIVLFDIPSNPMLGITLLRLFVFIMLLVGVFYANKVLDYALSDRYIINIILLGVMFNNHIIRISATIYPDIIAFGLFWFILHRILLYHNRQIITPQNWFVLVLAITTLVLVKYVYIVLFFWIVYLWFDKFKLSYKSHGFLRSLNYFKKPSIAIIIAVLPLAIWLQYLNGVDFGIEANESGFSQFKHSNESVFIRNLKKGIGIMPMEKNGRFNGLPAFINNFIPFNHFRDWSLSIFFLILVFFGLITNHIKRLNNTYRIFLFTIILVMTCFILSGTGFSRYWLPLFPIFYLGIRDTLKIFYKNDNIFIYFITTSIFFYILNEIRLTKVVLQSLYS